MSILDTFEYDHTDLNTVDQRMQPAYFSPANGSDTSYRSGTRSSIGWMLDQSAIGSMINDEEEMESEEEKVEVKTEVEDDEPAPLPIEDDEPAPLPSVKQRKPVVASKRKPKKITPLPVDTYDDTM